MLAVKTTIENMPPEKLFSPLVSLNQIFLYLCLVKRLNPHWLSGGRQT
jgi:hypothetical protein